MFSGRFPRGFWNVGSVFTEESRRSRRLEVMATDTFFRERERGWTDVERRIKANLIGGVEVRTLGYLYSSGEHMYLRACLFS